MVRSTPLPAAILISGSGTNLQSLIDSAARTGIAISTVISDRADAHGLERARRAGLPAQLVDPEQFAAREDFDAELARQVTASGAGLVILAGFMRILSPAFVHTFNGRTLNIHPSLLPLYRGLHTHRRVLEAGDAAHGCSIHFVTDELDGGPLVAQARISVHADDDENSLSARVQEREHKLYPLVVSWFAAGRLQMSDGIAWLDGERLHRPVVYAEDQEIK